MPEPTRGHITIINTHAAPAPAIGEELVIPFLIGEVSGSVISLKPGRQALITIESE